MKLEVIATNIEDVKKINESNADRIEFCSHLEVGGLTPSRADIDAVLAISKTPVNVMVRPTNRDFYYSEAEFQTMLEEVKYLATTKANGIVIGILNPDQTINMNWMKQIMNEAGDKQVTFHRAFEQLQDPIAGLHQLKELGVHSLLTSGNGDINSSFELLKALSKLHQVIIIGGSGVNLHNLSTVASVVNEIHIGSAIRQNNSWSEPIMVEKINEFKTILEKF